MNIAKLKRNIIKAILIFRREGISGIIRVFKILKRNAKKRNDYTKWIQNYDTLTDDIRAKLRMRANAFQKKPLITVIMPTYNSNAKWLIEAIESVRKQIYTNWELCIADDASTDKKICAILEQYAKNDSRIKVVFRACNGNISVASNDALALATGEWIALLDHDDVLAEHALFWVADAINKNSNMRLIYSDEDKIDERGRRSGPYFKCDWNIDLFYSHNMFCHLGVYQATLLREVGGFRLGFEGAQDYDLVLRCIEVIQANQIYHIPRVLYHWRVHVKSTSYCAATAKPYAMCAGERALNEHFIRQGVPVKVSFIDHGYRISYDLPKQLPLVTLIIPTKNQLHLIRQCIESILEKTTYENYEILIVDNNSDDFETLEYFRIIQSLKKIRIIRDNRPFNYSAINNMAVDIAHGELIGLLNNDTEVISPDWLSEMVSIALQPQVGAVGARLWYPNKTLQHGGVILGIGGIAGHSHKHLNHDQYGYWGRAVLLQAFSAVTGACLVMRKALYEEVGGLNAAELQIAFNDIDLCLKLRERGYRNVWTPYAELYHHESATRGYENTPEKQARFAKEAQYMQYRWGGLLLNDPAYNPNLTLNWEDFSLAWPPRMSDVEN